MKTKVLFACTKCGSQYPKWAGQCGECNAWNTLVEETAVLEINHKNAHLSGYAGQKTAIKTMDAIELSAKPRISTGMKEFDRALGGGLVAGSVVLVGGSPGVGKSTLLLQVLCHLAQTVSALYVTGEESLEQVALRARRLQLPDKQLKLLSDTQIERIISVATKEKPRVLVIDSIQTIFTELLSSAPGSVSQVRESAARLVRFAKNTNTALFLVGHVTKEGSIAGPRVLEHMVDSVLYFEGERGSRFRVIRAVKNRFGAVNELGVFAMTEHGLKEVSNPSAIFMSHDQAEVPGSVVMAAWEGSRPMLIEIQALVDTNQFGSPRRVTVGLDQNRLAMLLAVLHKHGGIAVYDQDVFANVVGGMRVAETSADLALVLAVVSSFRGLVLPRDLLVFGEIGLGGEIRPVPSGQERLHEALKHGFKRAIVPKTNAPKKPIKGLTVIAVSHLQGALEAL
jgi:DNA repair protein RadA/Sms